jgi:hypothetical protein
VCLQPWEALNDQLKSLGLFVQEDKSYSSHFLAERGDGKRNGILETYQELLKVNGVKVQRTGYYRNEASKSKIQVRDSENEKATQEMNRGVIGSMEFCQTVLLIII